jgi:uncharacterized protein (DUF924 family)
VIEIIDNSDNIPGLKSEEFERIKTGIKERWNELVEKGVLEITATDKDVRPYYVALQCIVEHVLACELNKSVFSLTGVIHTPMPATPLCTEGSISKELVDPSLEEDPLRLFTVKARTTIIRDYLFQGGDLYIAYPKEGMNKRTENQQQIYKNELLNHSAHLFDCPLDCASIDSEQIGAFYLFKNAQGNVFAFAIKMTQANSPQDMGSFGLWFGEITEKAIQQRISNVWNKALKYSFATIPLPISNDPRIQEVLTYWFGDLKSPDDYPENKSKIWFSGGSEIDEEIRNRFEPLVLEAVTHKLDEWKQTPRGRLALIILVDQFTRNIFRGTPQAFAFDPVAQELTLEGLDLGEDLELFPIERVFFYLPLEHAENLNLQEQSIAKFNTVAAEAPLLASYADYAMRHYVIIERFGRFPHRNVIIGRDSTQAEIEFLQSPNSSF